MAGMKGQEGKSREIRLSKWVRVADQVKIRSYKAFGVSSHGKCLSRKRKGQGWVWEDHPPMGDSGQLNSSR